MGKKHAIFDTEFRLVESGTEPTIRRMILHYYTSHGITTDQAKGLADRVVDAALLPTHHAPCGKEEK